MAKSRLLSNNSGFTLLETMIALAIMIVTLASIIAVESNSINATVRAKQMNTVAMLARNKMIELEYEVRGKTFDEVKKEEKGDFAEPFKDYTWSWAIKQIKFPSIGGAIGGSGAAQQGAASGGGAGANAQGSNEMIAMMMRLITNYLSKALREITVTIYWQRSGKEQSFAVSTYWVDLNSEFQLTE